MHPESENDRDFCWINVGLGCSPRVNTNYIYIQYSIRICYFYICIFNVFSIYRFNMHVEFERMYFSLTLSLDAYVFTWYRNPCNPVNLLVGGGAVGVVVVVVVMLVHWYYHQYAVHGAGQLGDTIGKGGTIYVDTHTFRLRGVNAWRLSKHQEERRLENLGEKCPGIS